MPYCSRCGVEVEPTVEKCPLCGTPIQQLEDEPPLFQKKYPDALPEKPKQERTAQQKRMLALEIVSISLALPLLIVLGINLIANKTVSWSLYPISALILIWILTAIPLLIPKRPIIIIPGEVIAVAAFLVIVDYLPNNQIDWYLNLALPTIALLGVIVTAIVLGARRVKEHGFLIAAMILAGVGLINLGLDLIIMSYVRGKVSIVWSPFVLIPTFLIAGGLLYFHFRLRKKVNLERRLQR
ncbi:MAG: hypothetical protein GF308_20500 [Candidatus Heimdallarchaeota archaeon]|nr:hypothetical protein [Candidatus Heimdallarchaeota archaeon]